MIIPIPEKKPYFSDPERFLVVLNRSYSKSDFLKAAQVVTDSYAEELGARIYDCLISHTVDILEEHQKYYEIEYPDLATFLYWRYDVPYDVVVEAVANLEPGYFLGYSSAYSSGDYVMGTFIRSKTGLEIVNRILANIREVNHENQN